MMSIETITNAALALPEQSRADLAKVLLDSLEESNLPLYWDEWEAEIRDRLEAYHRGEMKSYSREEVMSELDEEFPG